MTTLPLFYVLPNYHPECEAAINYQISLELYASYVYESMACFFNSSEVALNHLVQFFLQQSSTEREHAQRLMQLQNERGGHLSLQNLSSPDRSCWENSLTAMECAFHLKMSVNQSLLDLHQLAIEKRDANLCNFLKSHYWPEQMKFITELREHITNLRKAGAPATALAEDLSAKLTLEDNGKN